jgi:hypothetical protein
MSIPRGVVKTKNFALFIKTVDLIDSQSDTIIKRSKI